MKYFFLTLFLTGTLSSRLSGQITFQRTFGDSLSDYGQSVIQTPDSGYLVTGTKQVSGFTDWRLLLLRTDKLGNEIWTQLYTALGAVEIGGMSIEKTNDGNYIISGEITFSGSPYYDVYLLKVDSAGNELWHKTYGGSQSERGMSVKQTFDSGFIICGWTRSFGAGLSDLYVIKTDANGDSLWTKTYGGTNWEYGYAVEQSPDSGYVIVGNTQQTQIFVVKTNQLGDTSWTKIIYFTGTGEARDVKISDDGNIIIAGWISPTGVADFFLTKMDLSGNIFWFNTYGGPNGEWAYSLSKTADGGYAIFGNGNYDFYLVKTDSSGNFQWEKYFDNGFDYGYSARQTSDGGYIMAGLSVSGQDADVLLIKTDSLGQIFTSVNLLPDINQSISIYPNPSNNELNIHNNSTQTFQFTLYNSLGEKIINKVLIHKANTIDLSGYSNGIYFYKLISDKQLIKSGKLIKQ